MVSREAPALPLVTGCCNLRQVRRAGGSGPYRLPDEPIRRNGILVGPTTSGMCGHTFGACLAMGYLFHEEGVTREWIDSGTFDIEVAGVRVPTTAQLRPFYAAKIRS